jgi:hypothetical protein
MTTVLVRSDANDDHPIHKAMRSWSAPPPHVHHMTYDLAEFLMGVRPLAPVDLPEANEGGEGSDPQQHP